MEVVECTWGEDVPLLVLDLSLDIVDGVRRLNLKGDGLTREAIDKMRENQYFFQTKQMKRNNIRFDENLHLQASRAEHEHQF